jgi:hypothetical protein
VGNVGGEAGGGVMATGGLMLFEACIGIESVWAFFIGTVLDTRGLP